jgi:hypothetical protein
LMHPFWYRLQSRSAHPAWTNIFLEATFFIGVWFMFSFLEFVSIRGLWVLKNRSSAHKS